MAGDLRLDRIGQIRLSVQDVDRATAFYRDVLRMQHLFSVEEQGLAFFDCGGVRLFMASPEAGGPAWPTTVYYTVESVDEAYSALRERGVAFTHEPQTVYRTETVEGRMAFFEDGEGNTLAIMAERALDVA